jgi:Flp pilus assembly protein TadD
MDLTSLVLLAALMIGLVVSDAAVSGGNLALNISVPQKIAETGFTSQTAENVFTAEAARIGRTSSIVPPPIVETATHPGLFGALIKPLNLDQVALALRDRMGLETTTVSISVIVGTPSPAMRLIANITLPDHEQTKLALDQPDGDITTLIERSARAVLERAVPYRVALADLTAGVAGDNASLARAKQTAQTGIRRPYERALASQRVMLHNILAMLALLDGDRAEAERQFTISEPIPGASPAAHSTIALNRAFLAIADREPAKARAYFQEGHRESRTILLPKFRAHVDLVGGLVEWSSGDLDRAETALRDVAGQLPDDDEAHDYLGRLLVQRGKIQEGEAELRKATAVRRYDNDIGPLAHTLFYVDPANGGPLIRN